MNASGVVRNVLGAALLLAVLVARTTEPATAQAAPAPATAITWPSTFTAAGGSVTLYEPQIRTRTGASLLGGLAAVAVTPPGSATPVYGTLTFTSLASADVRAGTITLVNPHIDAIAWPGASASATPALDAFVQDNVHLAGRLLPIGMVLASLGTPPAAGNRAPLDTTPPTIFVSRRPGLLVVFDGKPLIAPLPGTSLRYAVNTNWPIIEDPATARLYLLATSSWLSTTALSQPWVVATPPPSFATIPATPEWADVLAHLNAQPAPGPARRVFVSTRPADLIVFAGDPQFAPIAGTQLRYVTNTQSDVFFSRTTDIWYVLLAGRWFRAANLNGPWVYASNRLPADFRKIPANSPRGRVLVYVPGTAAALFAGSAAQLPHIAPIDPATATLSVTYASDTPSFAPIAGTPLQYAVNTRESVIEVSATSYYAIHDAVWFSASSPRGPWHAATYVPAVIYTIPASSPLYPDTFVYVYNERGIAQTAPPATPVPQPANTYQSFGAGEFSAGDRAAYYSAYAGGMFGFFAYPFTNGNYNDTTFAQARARDEYGPSSSAPGRAQIDPSAGPPGPRITLGANDNIYADTDGNVYRYAGGRWQKHAGADWSATAAVSAPLARDRTARGS